MKTHRSETLVIAEHDFSLTISLLNSEKLTTKEWNDPERAKEELDLADRQFLYKTLKEILKNPRFRFSIPNSRDQVRVTRNDGYCARFTLETTTLYRPDNFFDDSPPIICTNEFISKEFFDHLTYDRILEIRECLLKLKSIREILEKINGEQP